MLEFRSTTLRTCVWALLLALLTAGAPSGGRAQGAFADDFDDALREDFPGLARAAQRWRAMSGGQPLSSQDALEFYEELGVGAFEGAPVLIWDAFADARERPTFRYVPSDFAYVTSTGRRIAPGPMDTNGGSIPQPLHAANMFSPWTYGTAFIIHDWIFEAQKCEIEPDADIRFEESALIMAEAMKTLMEVGFVNQDGELKQYRRAPRVVYLMYLAVKSPVARRLWNDASSVSLSLTRRAGLAAALQPPNPTRISASRIGLTSCAAARPARRAARINAPPPSAAAPSAETAPTRSATSRWRRRA